ncbi:serine/threonine-protein kinase [Sphaerisporangium sp. TRM90804]|uniref:serine/threonine-protein kinase n=1 Tax=Sphaerisporangium sp. TRM90804 TaxID=3031113 RepID=UPI00244CD61B|nr:serine/threonine-protein kinase [Sphaerisporangium sp. TRM90804]MDH2425656.1 serine/threonine-protein kinase [Sphaerisporangium sp. TRM90804]
MAPTVRDGIRAGAPGGLPAPLAGRYEITGHVGKPGAEADVLIVRDGAGEQFVLKLYRPGYRADRKVWSVLPRIRTRHVVRVLETGEDGGRDFEVQEYVAGHTLAELIKGTPMPVGQVTQAVRQLAGALKELHGHDIVHRDVKPANILVRSAGPHARGELDLVLADFGLSREIDASVVFGTQSRTVAYAPPECSSGAVSRHWDWWSLGMLVVEMATGRSPFAGMTESAVIYHLNTDVISVDGVADPRLRLLCRGLLRRSPASRWDQEEVYQWLAGGSPPVEEEALPAASAGRRVPLLFLGEQYTDRRALARAMVAEWDEAARRFLVTMGTPGHPSEGWRALRDFLQQFDDPAHDDVEGRRELIDRRLTPAFPPDVKLLHLLYWLDRELPPVYRGMAVTRENLLRTATTTMSRPGHDHTVDHLWTHHLLPTLAELTGAEELRGIDARWRWLENGFRVLASRVPSSEGTFDAVRVRSGLLALAVDEERTAATLREHAARARADLPAAVPWFSELLHSNDPAALLVAVLASGHARAWAQDRLRRDAQELAARQARQASLREAVRRREAARPQALGWAALAFGGFSLPWLLLTKTATAPIPSGFMALVWLCVGAGEAVMALLLGGAYHPRYSLLGPLGRVASGARRPAGGMRALTALASTGGIGCLMSVVVCMVVLYAVVLTAAVVVNFLILPIGVAVLYGVWTRRRWQSWEAEQRQERRAYLENA